MENILQDGQSTAFPFTTQLGEYNPTVSVIESHF